MPRIPPPSRQRTRNGLLFSLGNPFQSFPPSDDSHDVVIEPPGYASASLCPSGKSRESGRELADFYPFLCLSCLCRSCFVAVFPFFHYNIDTFHKSSLVSKKKEGGMTTRTL